MKASARELLSKVGLKYSKQREGLLELLMKSDEPLSAERCFTLLNAAHQKVNLSTIYRILEQFHQEKLLDKTYNSVQQGHVFSFILDHHRHYLICTTCHQMIPLDICPMHEIFEDLEVSTGFKISSHQIEVSGVCLKCQSQSNHL